MKNKKETTPEEAKWFSDLETLKHHHNKFARNEEGFLIYDTKENAEIYMRVSKENSDKYVDMENAKIKAEKEKDKLEKEEKHIEEHEDLKTYIFNEDEIIRKRVFSSHLLNNNLFGFGILLPKMEDVTNKKGETINQEQRWKPVIINSDRRGLPVSKWFQSSYKISYEDIPYEMRLRWELKDIDNFLHSKEKGEVNGLELFERIKKKYELYLYFRGKDWYDINSLWDLGTYFHQLFSTYPLKENRGLSGSAKTKSMVVSSYITLNATDIMINPSEATLFRETESLRPTKYIDEAEKLFKFSDKGIEPDNRVELINASYTRNGVVPRQEKIGNKFITKWYHVYSPTQISSINGLYGATENRAITQIHTKAPDEDKRGELDPEDDVNNESWKKTRNDCYRWALDNWKQVYENYTHFNIKTKLRKRDLQLWKPLLVLAKIIDEKDLLPKIINFAERLSEQRKNDSISESTLDYKYLNCVNEIIKESDTNKIYLENIRFKFNDLYGQEEKPKSNKSISTHLDKLGFKELREKNRQGAYYELTKITFDEIISPITNDFIIKDDKIKENSSQPSHSSQLHITNDNDVMNNDNDVMNGDEYNNNKSLKCDECDECDECDADSEMKGIKPALKKIKLRQMIEKLKQDNASKEVIDVYEKELEKIK